VPELAVVLEGADERDLTRISEYRAAGGYKALEKARGMDPEAVIEELLASNVRGRGGAFFPMGRKASFIPKPEDVPKPRYVVVNADESEPGTFKDREIMFRAPHRLVEGCLITAHAIRSQNVFIYIRSSRSCARRSTRRATRGCSAA
jgi:NADH-quinone oxidoreductase subunit F